MTRSTAILVLAFALAAIAVGAGDAAAASGRFKGASGHVTSGTATVEKRGSDWVLVLGSDFSFDGAPDPKWAFGGDQVDKATIFSALKKKTGAQTYRIPRSIDPTGYRRLYLWCERYAVPLGVAVLK